MSYSVVTTIWCDWCPEWVDNATTHAKTSKRVQMEKELEKSNWRTFKDGSHLCPECVEKGQKVIAERQATL